MINKPKNKTNYRIRKYNEGNTIPLYYAGKILEESIWTPHVSVCLDLSEDEVKEILENKRIELGLSKSQSVEVLKYDS